jgi:hypothetical protein
MAVGILLGCTSRTARPAPSLSAGRACPLPTDTPQYKDFSRKFSPLLNQAKFNEIQELLRDNARLFAAVLADPEYREKARIALENGIDPNLKDETGSSLLVLLCMTGKAPVESVQILLDQRADIDSRNFENATALMWATRLKQKEVIRLLLDKGADISIVNAQGENARSIAEGLKDREVLGWFSGRTNKHRIAVGTDAGAAPNATPPKPKVEFKLRFKPSPVLVGNEAYATLEDGKTVQKGHSYPYKDKNGQTVGEYQVVDITETKVVVAYEQKTYEYDVSPLSGLMEK